MAQFASDRKALYTDEDAYVPSSWWRLHTMVLVTGALLSLGAGIGIGVGIGAAVWENKADASGCPAHHNDCTMCQTTTHTGCPTEFQTSATAVPALAACNSNYVSFRPAVNKPVVCLGGREGKTPYYSATHPIAGALSSKTSPFNLFSEDFDGFEMNPYILMCPVTMIVLAWMHDLYATNIPHPNPCDSHVQEAFRFQEKVYEWEVAWGSDPFTPEGIERWKWKFSVSYWPDMALPAAAPIPTYGAHTLPDIKDYLERLTLGFGPTPYSSSWATFSYVMAGIGMLHANFLAADVCRSKKLANPGYACTGVSSVVYKGPTIPACLGSNNMDIPGFKNGQVVTYYETDDVNSLSAANHNTSTVMLQHALWQCANKDKDAKVVSAFMEMFFGMTRYAEAAGKSMQGISASFRDTSMTKSAAAVAYYSYRPVVPWLGH